MAKIKSELRRHICLLVLGSASLLLPQFGYSTPSQGKLLLNALRYYQQMASSKQWITFPEGVCLRPGDTLAYVAGLRTNLLLTGDLDKVNSPVKTLFNESITYAVKKFQRRHNLAEDGVVGQQTVEALNITPAQRVQQIQLNLRRWQTDSTYFSHPHVLVNIPDFSLQLVDETQKVIWQTRIIVGQTNKGFRTTVMSGKIMYLVVNPTWNIPQSIIQREIIPILKSDPAYLERNHMVLYRVSNSREKRIPAQAINWSAFNPAKESIRIIQEPGKWNALGKIKFIFPNPFDTYLHDTPVRSLFAQRIRTYSHGCIRVEHPEKLATYLLTSNWRQPNKVVELDKQTSKNKIILLPKPVPIKVGYYTCWVDAAGILQFRKDIYHLDQLPNIPPSNLI